MTRIFLAFVFALTLLTATTPAFAVEPDEILADPRLEARARTISKDLRCVVCQNQSIDDSRADIARDMRLLVRERLVAGDADQQVVDYLVARYGEYVLLNPPFRAATLGLWIGPPVMVLIVGAIIFMAFRAQQHHAPVGAPDPLSPSDRRRLDDLVSDLERKIDDAAARDEPGDDTRKTT